MIRIIAMVWQNNGQITVRTVFWDFHDKFTSLNASIKKEHVTEAVAWRCSVKKVFLKISLPATLLKRDSNADVSL